MKNTTLVIGASLQSTRYSNKAIELLVEKAMPTIAIGAKEGEVAGIKIYKYQKMFENIDTVTLYINPKIQEVYYDYVIRLCPRRVIFNPGTENVEFTKLLRRNHILVEEACTLVLLSINQYS